MPKDTHITGRDLHDFAEELVKPYRSITGDGVRESLRMIQNIVPITIHEVPSGTKAFDWTIPKEWNIRDAYVLNREGKKIIDSLNTTPRWIRSI